MTDKSELIDVREVCRICGWRTTQAAYHRVKQDPSFPKPQPKPDGKGFMRFNRHEIELWWANRLYEIMCNSGDMYVPHETDAYYFNLLASQGDDQ
jgi:predicted DNA-binding transcriptional regulator AlpA